MGGELRPSEGTTREAVYDVAWDGAGSLGREPPDEYPRVIQERA